MAHTDVDKHARSATAEMINLITRTTRKIVANFQVNHVGTTRIRARQTTTAIRHTYRITMVVSRARPPLLPPLLLLKRALEPPTTRAEIFSRASLAHSVTAIDCSTVVRHRRQHCRAAPLLISEDARVLLLACPKPQHRLPLSRAHGLLRRLRTIITA